MDHQLRVIRCVSTFLHSLPDPSALPPTHLRAPLFATSSASWLPSSRRYAAAFQEQSYPAGWDHAEACHQRRGYQAGYWPGWGGGGVAKYQCDIWGVIQIWLTTQWASTLSEEHVRILGRKSTIERRKEKAEQMEKVGLPLSVAWSYVSGCSWDWEAQREACSGGSWERREGLFIYSNKESRMLVLQKWLAGLCFVVLKPSMPTNRVDLGLFFVS
mgnify:CR=1 FL=1